MTGKLVKPDLYNLSRVRGPSISVALTKMIDSLLAMRSFTVRVSKLIIAAIRLRSLLLRMFWGVRFNKSMNSARDLGVYLTGWGLGVFLRGRYLSSLGSSQRVNFCIKLSNMILLL